MPQERHPDRDRRSRLLVGRDGLERFDQCGRGFVGSDGHDAGIGFLADGALPAAAGMSWNRAIVLASSSAVNSSN